MFNPTYRAQREASRKTWGIVPHPAVKQLNVPPGPINWLTVSVAGRPAQSPQPTQPSRNFPASGPTLPTYNRPPGPITSSVYGFAPSISASYFEERRRRWLTRKADWICEHIFPFFVLGWMCDKLDKAGQDVRIFLATGCGALVLATLRLQPAAWQPLSTEIRIAPAWIASGIAAVLGAWILPRVLARLIYFLTRTLAYLAFVTTACAGIIGVFYLGDRLLSVR